MKKLDVCQQLMLGVAGKVVRDFLKEEYLKCDCPTCRKLKRLHRKSEPYVRMVQRIMEAKPKKIDVVEELDRIERRESIEEGKKEVK